MACLRSLEVSRSPPWWGIIRCIIRAFQSAALVHHTGCSFYNLSWNNVEVLLSDLLPFLPSFAFSVTNGVRSCTLLWPWAKGGRSERLFNLAVSLSELDVHTIWLDWVFLFVSYLIHFLLPHTGYYTCVEVIFTLRRQVGFYMMGVYAPTLLIVVLSWLSFWINPDASAARVPLGMDYFNQFYNIPLVFENQINNLFHTMLAVALLSPETLWWKSQFLFR